MRGGRLQTVDAGYRPTPFSTARQVFRGTFDVSADAPDEPGRLVVEAYRSPEDRTPSLRVQVAYTRDAEAAKGPHPLLSRWIAGARIGAIAGAIQAPLALALRVLLRGLGRLLPWIEAPQTAGALPAPPEGRASLPA